MLAPVLVGCLLVAGLTAVVGHPGRRRSVIATTLSGASRPAAATQTTRPSLATTTTTSTTLASVTPAGQPQDPSAIVTLPAAVTPRQLQTIQAMKGVQAVEVVDTGTVGLEGAPANTIGVDPGTFRNFTPPVTAQADRLWQYISAGTLASSFEMSRDRKLTLGVEVPVAAAGSGTVSQQWLGAFMSIGLPGIDLVVSKKLSSRLGLSTDTGLVLSAPTADPFVLQTAIQRALPGASVVLMRPGLALGTAPGVGGGATVTVSQLSTALTAALSRVGMPYVWGGTGPNGFDCSGLVGWSFAAAGVDLPRTAAQQALAGAAVPLSQIQPGDLLFWAFDPSDPGFIDHVAIYLGKGEMVQAPYTGASVQVVPLQSTDLVGAVRINPAVAGRLGSPWRR